MSIVILDATKGENKVSDHLKEMLRETADELIYFKLENMNILPCRSCGACGFKSPGKCVLRDDSHEILKATAKCRMLVMLTPVKFGGYTSTLKKIVDKFTTLGLPGYMVKQGRLLHPARYGSKFILGIGIQEGSSEDQANCFRKLVEHNAFNMQSEHRAIVLKPSGEAERIKQEISSLIREVC